MTLSIRNMKRKHILPLTIVSVLVVSIIIYMTIRSQNKITYNTSKVLRGNMVNSISATGTIKPVLIVNVGSQVSGRIYKLYVDFNSVVKKGEIIAQIDPELFKAEVEREEANLESARANLKSAMGKVEVAKARIQNAEANVEREKVNRDNAEREFNRYSELFKKDLISENEKDNKETTYKKAIATHRGTIAELSVARATLNAEQANCKSAIASIKQSEAALNRAKANLEYTIIRSPVDGIVISRNVDEGQTVAATFQTPVLFEIAQDLTKMQVYASID
ncbi:MAG: biotin/lipoyl-binding protein, partial [Thermodesulfobacteriota bacterium]|nr:biotin/lipoyl-binding protein [Thermodesulfobacteriota bacterium]